ncbi:ATP-binding cassette domain-containing protein [Nocardia cyriacigeorgica]|uniref:ATP-binding cassette domain-containing protein n=1 Tax=Nocardia cyriacigeorgica TaxID=135487 RepID=UPI001E4C2144|nr:ATP-binding cassette domain-containing protein [Nocardia cyriacigeorgica]
MADRGNQGGDPVNPRRIAAVAPAIVVVVLALLGPSLAVRGAEQPIGIPFSGPSGDAWLGTDRLGRDVLSRLLYGGWGLLLTAAVIAVVVTVVASVLGAVAALRPRAGAVIELGMDFVILLPAVLGILLVLTSWPDAGVAGLIVLALLFGAPYCARVFAAAAAGVASSGYVEAAQAGGENLAHLVFREMMPNLREVFATQLGLRFVAGVYLVATASFLQLPTTLGATNWAVMVRDNTSGLLLNPWAALAPSLAIAVVAVSVNLAVSEFGRAAAPNASTAADADREVAELGEPTAAGLRASVGAGAMDGDPAADTAVGRPADVAAGAGVRRTDDAAGGVVVNGLVVVGSNGQKLLGPISFRAGAGSVTAVTGPSGCGKTTLLRLLTGQLPEANARVEGTVAVAGREVLTLGSARLRVFRRDRIAYVGQDPGSALNPLMRVRTLLAEVARDSAEVTLLDALHQVGLSADHLDRRPDELSGGQQRRVALARALVRRTDILVLDEPFAGLHATLRSEIAGVISGIAATGVTVLLTGHDTGTVHAIADQVVELGSVSAREGRTAAPAPGDESIVLRAQGVGASINGNQVLSGIDFALARGSALAVVGASGAGKTTLARVLAGLHRAAEGSLDLEGARLPFAVARRNVRVRNGIQLVTQNPKSALNPRRTVAQTLARPLRRTSSNRTEPVPGSITTRMRHRLLDRPSKEQLHERITALLESVELDPGTAARYPHELSGGQRQRVALARALAADPAVLVCDEITSALDHATADAIMSLLDRIRTERGTALLLITHDMTVVAAHCPDVLVLDHGRPVESGPTATVLTAPDHAATRELLH